MSRNIFVESRQREFVTHVNSLADWRSDANFFLSKAWAKTFFEKWPADDFFLGMSFEHDGTHGVRDSCGVVCFSLGVRSSQFSRSHRSLALNESSAAGLSYVTAEANGLICSAGIQHEEWIPAVLHRLATVEGWDELRVNSLSAGEAVCLMQSATELGMISHIHSEGLTYWVDLDLVRSQYAGDYLASRSANTRQQLRRSLRKLCDTHGDLRLSRASDVTQGHQWLDALAELHKARWNTNTQSSGFMEPQFARFHHDLVECMLESGDIDILEVRAGNEVLAYLYNYFIGGRVYFSMSGVAHENLENFKPGILAHWKAIEFYQARDARIYDFQGGTGQYKKSLATHQVEQMSIVVRRPLLKFRLEAVARGIKRRVWAKRTGAVAGFR